MVADPERADRQRARAPWRGGYPDLCPEAFMVDSDQGGSVRLSCALTAGHVPPHWDAAQLVCWHDPAAGHGD